MSLASLKLVAAYLSSTSVKNSQSRFGHAVTMIMKYHCHHYQYSATVQYMYCSVQSILWLLHDIAHNNKIEEKISHFSKLFEIIKIYLCVCLSLLRGKRAPSDLRQRRFQRDEVQRIKKRDNY